MTLTINTPIWNGGKHAVGIAEYRIKDNIKIKIAYKDRYGNKLYPYTYRLTREQALKYPVKMAGQTRLRIVPIRELEIVKNTKVSLDKPQLGFFSTHQ